MAGLRVHFVFPAGLVERVDAALTVGQSRGEFVREAVEQALGSIEAAPALSGHKPSLSSPAPTEQPPSEPPFEPKDVYRGPEVEAEERSKWPSDREGRIAKIDGILKEASEAISPVGRSRSSVHAKRDVRPVPKAKP